MQHFGEGFKPLIDLQTGKPIPGSPMIAVTPGPNSLGVVVLPPVNRLSNDPQTTDPYSGKTR